MTFLFLAVVFAVHALVFVRLYSRHPERIHLILTVSGFVHLALFYGYRAYAYFEHPTIYLDWATYLRWSGAVMSIIGLPPTAKLIYARVRARMGRRSTTAGEEKPTV